MIAKRALDIVVSAIGLILLVPLFVAVAAWIKLDSRGPVFFRQQRVGQFGRLFRIMKFRTMFVDSESKGRQITAGNDARITRAGHFLRRHKLDELPQLLNVLKGDMSLVGPRPEVPRYVAMYPDTVRELILSVRPGITDDASIEYKEESTLLGDVENPETVYVERIMPAKLRHYERYALERSMATDVRILLRTLKALVA